MVAAGVYKNIFFPIGTEDKNYPCSWPDLFYYGVALISLIIILCSQVILTSYASHHIISFAGYTKLTLNYNNHYYDNYILEHVNSILSYMNVAIIVIDWIEAVQYFLPEMWNVCLCTSVSEEQLIL